MGVEPEVILSLAFWMILPAIVGARAFYVTEYWSEQYWPVYGEKGLAALLLAVVNVANGGLVIYGGFFGGVVGLVAFFWKYRVPLLATADLVAPSLMLGLAIGRIGCLLNGCCYGGACDLPWAVTLSRRQSRLRQPGRPRRHVRLHLERQPEGGADRADGRCPTRRPTTPACGPATACEASATRRDATTNADAHRALARLFAEQEDRRPRRGGRAAILRLSAIAPPARSHPVHPTQLYSTHRRAADLPAACWPTIPFAAATASCGP